MKTIEKTESTKVDAKKIPFFAKKLTKAIVVKSGIRAGYEPRAKSEESIKLIS